MTSRVPGDLMMSGRAVGRAAYALSCASVICGYSLLLDLTYGFAQFVLTDKGLLGALTWRTYLFAMTRPEPFARLLVWMGTAAVSGGLAYRLVHRERRRGKVSLPAATARLATCGLVGASLDVAILGLMLGYRWFG